MRNFICILALLCTVYALEQDVLDPSRNLERLVNLQKDSAKAVLDTLQLFEEQTKQNLEMKFNEMKAEALVDIHTTITTALENVNLSIERGKKEGKDVNECYIYAKNNLETKNTNAIGGLDTCIQNGYTAMQGPLANVANTIEAAKKLLIDLDAIIPGCYSTNFVKMQACVMRNLVLTRASLNRIENNAGEVRSTAVVTSAKTIIDVRACITENASDTRTFSTFIVVYTDNCVRNAPENTPKPSTTVKLPTSTAKSTM